MAERSPEVYGTVSGMDASGRLLVALDGGAEGLVEWNEISRQEKLRQDLLSNGLYETASVVAIEQDWRVRVNGRSPYRVICRVEREGVLHEYRSHLIYDLPALQVGDPIKVYLDWQDDKRFYVDVESASPAVIRHG